jgi:hypothetical protein
MDTILTWIGFDQEATSVRVREESFDTFADLATINEKDIHDLSESYIRRTVADGRAIFGLRRILYMIGLIHWAPDFGRVGEEPSLEVINDAEQFKAALDEASQRADVRKIEKDQSDTVSKAAEEGKFKDDRKWPEWEPAFTNYLSTIPGVNGIPLSYVIRESYVPDRIIDYPSFNERAIACAPLTGPNFQADARKVHQLLKSFLQTETAEQWIKPIARWQSGREDTIALTNHYSGEGNSSRRIAQAEGYRDTLYYKHVKSLSFSNFLDKIQKMLNMFQEEGESITEQAKVQMLLKKIQHPQLQNAVSALRIRAQLDSVTFTECANHLSAIVSEWPDHQLNRKVSATDSKPKAKRIGGGGSGCSLALQTGILLLCNKAPIIWHSKRQNTVEASTFGSEFQAMKNAVDLTEAMRYKRRMFGVPLDTATNVFSNNEGVYKNMALPESTLKKKHHSIAYHHCREAVAAGTIRVAKEGIQTYLSNLFTKLLPQPRREELLDKFTYLTLTVELLRLSLHFEGTERMLLCTGGSGKSILIPIVLFFLCTVVPCSKKILSLTPKCNVCIMYIHYGICYESYHFCREKDTYFGQTKTCPENYDWVDIFSFV